MPTPLPAFRLSTDQPPGCRPKVVLYNPQAVFYTMPLGVLAVASQLDPDRYEVVVVDGRLEKHSGQAVVRHLDGAVCLGVSVLTGAPIDDALRVSRAAKQYRPDIPVVWGGWHPSMFGLECLQEPSVDITVQGQGEATFAEIVERLVRCESLEGCLGCGYRAAGEPRLNPPRPLQNLNAFRPANYGLLDVARYFAMKGKRQLDYITSHGCLFRCAFCADPFVYQRKWEGLDPDRIGDEAEALWNRYHFDDLSFQDETFFTYAQRVDAIADQLLRRNLPITWAATLRADQCFRLPEETFVKCKRSGLRRVIIGVESGSQEMIDRIQKDIRLDQVFFAAERCQRHDIAVKFPFIVGFPGESDESVRQTLNVAKRLNAMSPKFETPIFYFRPYPGTALTAQAVQAGFRFPATLEQWSSFDYVGSTGPWVSAAKFRLVERYKFYQALARSCRRRWNWPVRALARWRLNHDVYAFPVEKAVSDWVRPAASLS